MDPQLITLDPGHFHAALVQKEMIAGVAPRVHVYAPLGPDLLAHLQRIDGFNSRAHQPTRWQLEVHAGPDYLERLGRERPGQVVVLAGRNRRKLEYLETSVAAGLHVLADKPWVILPEQLPRLRTLLDQAEARSLVAYDVMTERYEITSILQRELVRDREVFGQPLPGSPAEPAVYLESVHYLSKLVAGVHLRRPAWFFDIAEQGEGLSDVGTHLVDLVMWVLFPDQPIQAESEIDLLAARRWPTVLTGDDFREITGGAGPDRLEYFCNNQLTYTLRGIHVRLDVLWGLRAEPGGGDRHHAVFQGSRSRVEVRQSRDTHNRPELYVVPQPAADLASLGSALQSWSERQQTRFPGLAVLEESERFWVQVPDRCRTGHEAHFAEVARQFLGYLQAPRSVPAWEKANLLAKYQVTTRGVQLARQAHPSVPSH